MFLEWIVNFHVHNVYAWKFTNWQLTITMYYRNVFLATLITLNSMQQQLFKVPKNYFICSHKYLFLWPLLHFFISFAYFKCFVLETVFTCSQILSDALSINMFLSIIVLCFFDYSQTFEVFVLCKSKLSCSFVFFPLCICWTSWNSWQMFQNLQDGIIFLCMKKAKDDGIMHEFIHYLLNFVRRGCNQLKTVFHNATVPAFPCVQFRHGS